MKILETAMGTLAGMVGALGGMAFIGIMVAGAILAVPMLCCVLTLVGAAGQ